MENSSSHVFFLLLDPLKPPVSQKLVTQLRRGGFAMDPFLIIVLLKVCCLFVFSLCKYIHHTHAHHTTYIAPHYINT